MDPTPGIYQIKNNRLIPLDSVQHLNQNQDHQDADNLATHLKEMTVKLSKIKLMHEEKLLVQECTEKLPHLHEKFVLLNTKRVMKTIHDLAIANPHMKRVSEQEMIEEAMKRGRKNQLYASKLKVCTRIYSNLNDKLVEQINSLKRLYASAQGSISTFKVSKEEIYQLESKIKRYDAEILKLEKKYPWLKNSELKLPSIMAEILKLETLRQQHDQLKIQLDSYRGLSCDLTEARQKLTAIKSQFEKLNASKS